eukprot:4974925-Karenia_brevis.AAC.1
MTVAHVRSVWGAARTGRRQLVGPAIGQEIKGKVDIIVCSSTCFIPRGKQLSTAACRDCTCNKSTCQQ